MKKTFITAGIMTAFMLSATLAIADNKTTKIPSQKPDAYAKQMPPKGDKPTVSERLKLTEEQKQKAQELHKQGQEQIKPLFEKIQYTKQEIKNIEDSQLSEQEKNEKLAPLNEELKQLRFDAKKIRVENTQKFESMLNDEQKAEFEKIKQEARERIKQRHLEMQQQK